MEKKVILFFVLAGIMPLAIASMPPQFLYLQGNVFIDGRTAPDNSIVEFSISGTEIAESYVSNGKYGPVMIQGYEDYYGLPLEILIINGTKEYEAEQKINYASPQDMILDISAETENGLKIADYYPKEKELMADRTGEVLFNVTAVSGYPEPIAYSWFLDNDLISDKDLYNYEIQNSDSGKHNITVIASDGYLEKAKSWDLIIARPKANNFDGQTTDFDSMTLDELAEVNDVVLEKTGTGKIEFSGSVNLTGITNLNNIVKLENGIIAIDTLNYPQLNKPAKITLERQSYTSIPKIYYSNGFTTNSGNINQECAFCKIENYTKFPTINGEVVFSVAHFTSFRVAGSGVKYDISLFRDLDACENNAQGNLEVNLKKPDDNDDFAPGDTINVRLKVKNNNDEKKNIITEAVLYDIDEEEEIVSEESRRQKIDSGDSEDFELELKIPRDIDSDGRYIVFVKTYEDYNEETQCSQEAVDVNVEREKHEVVIENLEASPNEVSPGEYVSFFVDVLNKGENDEDIYLEVVNEDLDISEKSEIFELEEFGRDDSKMISMSVKIPDNAKEETYDFEVNAVFDNGEDSAKTQINISKIVKKNDVITLVQNAKEPVKMNSLINTDNLWKNIDIALGVLIGVVFLLILIVIVRRK